MEQSAVEVCVRVREFLPLFFFFLFHFCVCGISRVGDDNGFKVFNY